MVLNDGVTRCSLCGHVFQTEARGHCEACPLSNGCHTTCCPVCGYVDIDTRQSTIVRWLERRRGKGRRRRAGRSLASVPPGCLARIANLDAAPAVRRSQLRAYGLLVGDWVRIVQQSPVTVAVVERTEIALETGLADTILVDSVHLASETTSAT
jgi:Fe2+ transport system protein FeoA